MGSPLLRLLRVGVDVDDKMTAEEFDEWRRRIAQRPPVGSWRKASNGITIRELLGPNDGPYDPYYLTDSHDAT